MCSTKLADINTSLGHHHSDSVVQVHRSRVFAKSIAETDHLPRLWTVKIMGRTYKRAAGWDATFQITKLVTRKRVKQCGGKNVK